MWQRLLFINCHLSLMQMINLKAGFRIQFCTSPMARKVAAIVMHHSTLSCFQRAEALSENKAASNGNKNKRAIAVLLMSVCESAVQQPNNGSNLFFFPQLGNDGREEPTRLTHPCINASPPSSERIVGMRIEEGGKNWPFRRRNCRLEWEAGLVSSF